MLELTMLEFGDVLVWRANKDEWVVNHKRGHRIMTNALTSAPACVTYLRDLNVSPEDARLVHRLKVRQVSDSRDLPSRRARLY